MPTSPPRHPLFGAIDTSDTHGGLRARTGVVPWAVLPHWQTGEVSHRMGRHHIEAPAAVGSLLWRTSPTPFPPCPSCTARSTSSRVEQTSYPERCATPMPAARPDRGGDGLEGVP